MLDLYSPTNFVSWLKSWQKFYPKTQAPIVVYIYAHKLSVSMSSSPSPIHNTYPPDPVVVAVVGHDYPMELWMMHLVLALLQIVMDDAVKKAPLLLILEVKQEEGEGEEAYDHYHLDDTDAVVADDEGVVVVEVDHQLGHLMDDPIH